MQLMPHQASAVEFLLDRPAMMLAFDVGCLTGDTVVTVNKGGNGKKITLSQLFNKTCIMGDGRWYQYLGTDYMRIRALGDGVFRLVPFSAVMYSGKKPVFLLVLENGKEIRATADHRILTTVGWVQCANLTKSHEVLCNGERVCKICGGTKRVASYAKSVKNKGICKSCERRQVQLSKTFESFEIARPKASKVISLTYQGVEDTYDVTVPGVENFVANGIVVHNCGKTAIAIRVIEHEKLTHKRKAVVICPSYLTRNWAAECKKFSNCLTTDIQKDGKYEADRNADVIIASYGMLEAVEHHIKERKVVVYDEAHYLCGRTSNRSKLAQDLCRVKLHRLLLLTGTPMRNRISDLYALFWMMDRVWSHGFLSKFHGYKDFCETFCQVSITPIPGKHFSKVEYHGHKNLEWLRPWLNVFWMRCHIGDVVDLPPISYEEIEIDGVSEAIERKLEVAWAQHESGVVAGKHQFGENVGEHNASAKKMSASAKAPMTAEYVLDLLRNEGGPLLVFSDHREACERIATILKTARKPNEKATYCVEMIRGDTSTATRHNIVDRYQRGEIDVICATIGALQMGVTLTRGNVCIFNDSSWDPSANAQSAGRIYRIGQDKPCLVYTCVGGPIDAKIVKVLRAKERTIKEVMK